MGIDMRRFLRRWLNNVALQKLGDRYEGVISDVLEEEIRNKFTFTKQLEPVIVFEDGWRLLPNIGMRRALIQFWGSDTDEWIGQRVVVYRHPVERTDPETGEIVVRYEKRVMRTDLP